MLKRPGAAQTIALIFVLIPAFAAGSVPESYTAALLLLAGVFLLLFRPVAALPRSITYTAFALPLGACLAFLPVDWFGRAEWRTTVESYGNIALGTMVTPQPWHTLQGVAMLLAGVAFGLFLLSQPVNGETHEKLAGAFTLGVAAYAGFSIFAACTGWRHPWDIYGTFGFLSNRNHVGTLLAMGAVAGLGSFWNLLERRRWVQAALLGAAIILIAFATLAFCQSRAAAVLLFAGFFLWLAGVFRRGIDRRIALSALVLMLFTLAIFITSQTPAMQRLKTTAPVAPVSFEADPADQPGKEHSIQKPATLEFRLLLYKDTCRMIADHLFTGIGLGNFRYISQQYREASLSQALALHPDNSWLLIAAEAGLPTAIAAGILVFLGFLRLRGCQRHPSWSVRWASGAALAIFLAHCAVDVPGHRAATLMPALFLAGLAFRQAKRRYPQPCLSLAASRGLFAVSGVAFLLAGAWLGGWLPATRGKLPSEEVERAPDLVYSLYQQNRTEEAISLAQNILARTPLASELYFQWGSLALTFEGTDRQVEQRFAIERILEPHFIGTPLRQAALWLRIDPTQSLRLYSEAMERADKQDQCSNEHYARRTFTAIMQSAASLPDSDNLLYPLTGNRPELLLLWSRKASPDLFYLILHKIFSHDPSLEQWSLQEKRKLLGLWWQKGNRTEIQQMLHEHPAMEEAAWPILVGDLVGNLQYEEAWRSAEMRLHLDTAELVQEEGGSARLRAAYNEHKTAIAAERLAKALLKEQDFEEVLRLAGAAKGDFTQSPNLSRIASVAAARLSRWSEAWKHLVAMAQVDHPELGLK